MSIIIIIIIIIIVIIITIIVISLFISGKKYIYNIEIQIYYSGFMKVFAPCSWRLFRNDFIYK